MPIRVMRDEAIAEGKRGHARLAAKPPPHIFDTRRQASTQAHHAFHGPRPKISGKLGAKLHAAQLRAILGAR